MALIGSCFFLPSSGLLLCALYHCDVRGQEDGNRRSLRLYNDSGSVVTYVPCYPKYNAGVNLAEQSRRGRQVPCLVHAIYLY